MVTILFLIFHMVPFLFSCLECFEDNKSGGEIDLIISPKTSNITYDQTRCKEKCKSEDFCEAFVFSDNSSDSYTCSLNTFGSYDAIVNDTGKVFGFKYCAGTP